MAGRKAQTSLPTSHEPSIAGRQLVQFRGSGHFTGRFCRCGFHGIGHDQLLVFSESEQVALVMLGRALYGFEPDGLAGAVFYRPFDHHHHFAVGNAMLAVVTLTSAIFGTNTSWASSARKKKRIVPMTALSRLPQQIWGA